MFRNEEIFLRYLLWETAKLLPLNLTILGGPLVFTWGALSGSGQNFLPKPVPPVVVLPCPLHLLACLSSLRAALGPMSRLFETQEEFLSCQSAQLSPGC